jgi:hypothetical protein
VFASAAHRAACQACLCLATPWLVPGSERAWSALSPNVRGVVHRARSLQITSHAKWSSSRLSYPSSRNHLPRRMLSRLVLTELCGVPICTHLGGFCGGVSR